VPKEGDDGKKKAPDIKKRSTTPTDSEKVEREAGD